MNVDDLICPRCHGAVKDYGSRFVCTSGECQAIYPIIKNIPIMINEDNSIFRMSDYTDLRDTSMEFRKSAFFRIGKKLVPSISHNLKALQNYSELSRLLERRGGKAKVLVIGGGELGRGISDLLRNPSFDVVETDVSLGSRTELVCDAHDLPFKDQCFDAVIAQAVLEHVVDPYRVVSELHRVLGVDGYIYAETPFMQQVHMGCYDFTRFTYLGHRRLFRNFQELRAGYVSGSGESLAWAIKYFLLSFFSGKPMRLIVAALSHYLLFWLKYLDYLALNKDAAFDSASAFFFFGKRSEIPLGDRDLINLYRGAGSF